MWLIMPKPGRIRMYTSGCPKNQNRCWNITGSPPPAASKKWVLKLRSVSSMVIAPASTGSESSSRNTVTRIDHTNSGIRCRVMPGARMLKMVVMKLMAPRTPVHKHGGEHHPPGAHQQPKGVFFHRREGYARRPDHDRHKPVPDPAD